MKTEFKVGQRAICNVHQEDVVITKVIREGYYEAEVVRLPGTLLNYFTHELEPWKFRRFVIDGNHHMRMHDDSNEGAGKFIGTGSWGVRDTIEDRVVFYVTSGASRMIAMEICKQMNAGMLLKEFTK